VWLDRPPGATELALHEVGADGVTVGAEVRRTRASDLDEQGLTRFTFDRIPESAGRRYLFRLTCPGCPPEARPYLLATREPRRPAGLVTGDRVDPGRTANFTPVYNRLPAAEPPATELRASRPAPGKWRIEVSGARPSLLVVAESYFPGWEAKVDGEKRPVMEADGAFLGVAVGAGRHEVTLEYHRSVAFPLGLAVTGLTLLVCAALLVPGVRRRRNRRAVAKPE
jgi:Bacterial membrane protein YfhO